MPAFWFEPTYIVDIKGIKYSEPTRFCIEIVFIKRSFYVIL